MAAAFADNSSSDDDERHSSVPIKGKARPSTQSAFQSAAAARLARSMQQTLAQDPHAFDFDETFESTEQQRRQTSLSAQSDSAETKSRYMTSLLAAARQRQMAAEVRRDLAQAADGVDGAESFITPAYAQQLAERDQGNASALHVPVKADSQASQRLQSKSPLRPSTALPLTSTSASSPPKQTNAATATAHLLFTEQAAASQQTDVSSQKQALLRQENIEAARARYFQRHPEDKPELASTSDQQPVAVS